MTQAQVGGGVQVPPAERSGDSARLQNLLATVALGLSDRIDSAAIEAAGLDRMAVTALVALVDLAPDGSVQRLAQGVGLSHSGAVRLVDRLAVAGLVRREAGPDQRSVRVSLTGKGRKLALRVRSERARHTEAALTGLTDRQRRELARACELVLANLTTDRLAQRSQGVLPAGGALCRMCDFAACGRDQGRCPTANTAAR